MSNLYRFSKSDEQKTIQLKPIEVEKEKESEIHNGSEEVDQQAVLEDRIAEAETKIEEAKQQAEQMINEAQAQIDHEREQFEAEKEEAYKQAHEQGYHKGYQEGKDQGEAHFNELIEQATSVVQQANLDYHEKISSSDKTILLIAMKAAEKVVYQHLQDDEARLIPLIHKTIDEVSDQPDIKVYVHVNQYKMVLEQKELLQSMLNEYSSLSIYPKKSIEEYGCVIETEQGQIDTSLDTQLNELKRYLFKELEG